MLVWAQRCVLLQARMSPKVAGCTGCDTIPLLSMQACTLMQGADTVCPEPCISSDTCSWYKCLVTGGHPWSGHRGTRQGPDDSAVSFALKIC